MFHVNVFASLPFYHYKLYLCLFVRLFSCKQRLFLKDSLTLFSYFEPYFRAKGRRPTSSRTWTDRTWASWSAPWSTISCSWSSWRSAAQTGRTPIHKYWMINHRFLFYLPYTLSCISPMPVVFFFFFLLLSISLFRSPASFLCPLSCYFN